MPQISVIVPVYKVEPYIRRCVDSILVQTFADFELILVDDGSPDNCGKICDEYAEKDARVHVVHQKNGGLSAARNAGLDWSFDNSESSWIGFLDSDDWVHPCFLEYLYCAAINNDVKISICDYIESEGKEEVLPCSFKADRINWEPFFLNNNVKATVAWNKLYSKELFINIRYPNGKLHEDEFISYKLLDIAGDVAFVPVPLYFYYHNSEGITKRKFSLRRMDIIEAFEERVAYFISKKNEKLSSVSCMVLMDLYLHYDEILEQYDQITKNERGLIKKNLIKRAKRTLVLYGRKNCPFRTHLRYYSFAFPHVMSMFLWIYRTMKRLWK